MRKSLRKKLHLGEFREFGTELRVTLRPGVDFETFLDDFIVNAIEAHELAFGGGGKAREVSGTLEFERLDGYQPKLAAVEPWLQRHGSVKSFDFGELVDLWHDH